MRKTMYISLVMAFLLAFAGAATAAGPNFIAAIWGDGELWSTIGVATLRAPNAHNVQSYDKLFVILGSNNPMEQLPVAEAAPGNPNYNGGRWFTHTATWTAQGIADHGIVPILTSYDEIIVHYNLGHLDIQAGTVIGGPMPYFECPLLPVK